MTVTLRTRHVHDAAAQNGTWDGMDLFDLQALLSKLVSQERAAVALPQEPPPWLLEAMIQAFVRPN
jgi:hypothetical protein